MARQVTTEQFADFLNTRKPEVYQQLGKYVKLISTKITSDIKYNMAHTQLDMSTSYYTNNKTKAHHPSMPGQPPAVDTGNLRNSIRYEIVEGEKDISAIIGSTQKDPPYVTYLEYGTSSGGWGGKGMAPRPWLRPAMRNNLEFIKKNLAIAIKRTLGGGEE